MRFCRPLRKPTVSQVTTYTRAIPLYRNSYGTHRFASTTMATAFQIKVGHNNVGLCGMKQSEAVATKVSELLQADMEKHHVYFNEKGFHNHITHHLLALYGTGSDARALDTAYEKNASYQKSAKDPQSTVVEDLESDYKAAFQKYSGSSAYYSDFLHFYQKQIDELGWQAAMTKYVFSDDEVSKDLFERLFSGVLHPLIQLMYGVEWEQPAIVAEGLAQAAIHQDKFGALFAKIDEKARSRSSTGQRRPLVELCENIRKEQPALAQSPKLDDNDLFGGLRERMPEETAEFLAANISVDENNIEEEIDQMVHTAAYVAAAAAFHGSHKPKYDFFIIHHVTVTPFFVWLKSQSWISNASKAHLLHRKLCLDAVDYICRGSPTLSMDPIRAYVPSDMRTGNRTLVSKPEDLLPRFHATPDDGHIIKTARALLLAQRLTAKYLDKQPRRAWLRVTDDEAWLKTHYALLDAVEGIPETESRFVRSAGFDEAWADVPKLEK